MVWPTLVIEESRYALGSAGVLHGEKTSTNAVKRKKHETWKKKQTITEAYAGTGQRVP